VICNVLHIWEVEGSNLGQATNCLEGYHDSREDEQTYKSRVPKEEPVPWVLSCRALCSQGVGATRHQWTRKPEQAKIISFNQSTIGTQGIKRVCMHLIRVGQNKNSHLIAS
jgi:hypothetical protein